VQDVALLLEQAHFRIEDAGVLSMRVIGFLRATSMKEGAQ
jgi:hypothetical protein